MLILETQRLIVRRWTAGDEEALYAICSDPLVMRFVGEGAAWSRERTREFIADAMATEQTHGYCRWPLILKEEGLLAGFCGFTPAEKGAEMGWRLAAQHWGRGLATEAARAVFGYGREKLGLQRITATVQAGNAASLRVAEKLGMTLAGRISRHGRDILVLATLAAKAPALRAGEKGEERESEIRDSARQIQRP